MLYHVTPYDNLESILKNGLIPTIGPRSAKIGGVKPAVYLFQSLDEVEDALMNWMVDDFEAEDINQLIILEIQSDNIAINKERNVVIVKQSILPSSIVRVLDEDMEEIAFKNTSGVTSIAAHPLTSRYAHGDCVAFAAAVSRAFHWPIVEITADGRPLHAACRMPNGNLFDAYMESTEESVIARYENLAIDKSTLTVSAASEDRIMHWSGLDDDAEVVKAIRDLKKMLAHHGKTALLDLSKTIITQHPLAYKYTHSESVSFAIAAHRSFEWPLVAITLGDTIIHAACSMPNGNLFDALMYSNESDLMYRFSHNEEPGKALSLISTTEDMLIESWVVSEDDIIKATIDLRKIIVQQGKPELVDMLDSQRKYKNNP